MNPPILEPPNPPYLQEVPTLGGCAGAALGKNGLGLASDVAGLIPGEGVVKGTAEVGLGVAAIVDAVVNGDTPGTVMGTAGVALSVLKPYAKRAGWAYATDIPVAGKFLAAAGLLYDLGRTAGETYNCMSE